MIVTEDNQSNWITRPSATLSTANTRLQLGLNQGFSYDRPVINHLSHGIDAQDETTDKYLHQWICSCGVHGTYALLHRTKSGDRSSAKPLCGVSMVWLKNSCNTLLPFTPITWNTVIKEVHLFHDTFVYNPTFKDSANIVWTLSRQWRYWCYPLSLKMDVKPKHVEL
jgi:hypothetical protein